MTKKTLIRGLLFLLSLALGIGVFAYFVYQEGFFEIIESLQSFGVLAFIGFITISLLNFVFYSWRWQIIINNHLPKKERVPLARMYLHRLGGYAVSYLTPAAQVGGEPVRIALLSSEGVSLKAATSSVILDIAFELSAYIVFIIAGVLLAILQGFGDGESMIIIVVGLSVTLAILILFFVLLAYGKGFFVHLFRFTRFNRIKKLQKFEKGIIQTEQLMTDFLAKKKQLLFIIAALSMTVISFRVVEVFYIASFFGVELNFAQAFLTSTLPGIALLMPVPAGLGLFEGGFSAVFSILNVPLNAVAFALIIRLRDVVFIFFGLLHILSRGRKFVESKVLKGTVN
ncbi:MAG: lysylphosphatidylglycerol synthase transmembrane domain-containing protein [Patescibacteria group bacterium]